MSRTAYVNGRYVPQAKAQVSIEDRGYQFADGVYEVIEVLRGALIDEPLHLARLRRSLGELQIAAPLTEAALRVVSREVISRNRVRDGLVYIQVTRGVAARDHVFPPASTPASVVVTAKPVDGRKSLAKAAHGIRVITMPDQRWKRPDIKSISLLPNVLAKQQAATRGAGEAWLIGADGLVSEGAASNAWIVDESGCLRTHPVDQAILQGVTRTTLMSLIQSRDLAFDERSFSLEEAYRAREAFVTGATTIVMPVIAIDDRPVGNGSPGPITRDLRRGFHAVAQRSL